MARSARPADLRSRAPRPAASVSAVVSAVVLVALVALGAGPHDRTTQLPAAPVNDRALVEFTAAVTFILLLMLGFFGVRIVLLLIRDRNGRPPAEAEVEGDGALEVHAARWLQVALVAVVSGLVALCVYLLFQFFDALRIVSDGGGDAPGATEPTQAVGGPSASPVGQSVYGNLITILVIIGGVVVVLAVLAGIGRSRVGSDPEPQHVDADGVVIGPDPESVPDPFGADLGELAARPPVEAVVGAFVLADAMLRVDGRPRRWGETSAEWVTRIGPALPGPARRALAHLLSRYHEARFSEHPIPPTHRDDAIEALRVLRDELRTPAPLHSSASEGTS